MMQKLIFTLIVVFSSPLFAQLEIGLPSEGTERLHILLAVTPVADKELHELAHQLANNLQRSGQFRVAVKGYEPPSTHADLKKLLDPAYPLEIFLNREDGSHFSWRLYDVHDAQLIKGMKYAKKGRSLHGFADNMADELWPILTKQPGSFSTKIAYVKRKQSALKRQRHVVCVMNSDGSHEQELIEKIGTYVGLYFDKGNSAEENPCLFCSEFTRSNVRLISTNFERRKKIVLNVPGTCVGISVAQDNNKAVYCRSGTIWHYDYNPSEMRSEHRVLVKNDGNNVSPTLLENGDVVFCTDSKKLRKSYPKATGPQICLYHADDGLISLLTQEGYCVGPSYCPRTKKIAFSKKVQGIMQLCVYDMRTKDIKQITHDQGHKIDCCWSPCGNYIVYCHQQGKESRIAIIHNVMKKRTFLTAAKDYCTSPAWSGVFQRVPMVGALSL